MTIPALGYVAIALGLVAAGEGIYIYASTRDDGSADTVTAVADVVDSTADVVDETGAAVNAVQLAELEVSAALATAPAASITCTAAVVPEASDKVIAACAYTACMSHVEGSEGATDLGCRKRGETLDRLLGVPVPE